MGSWWLASLGALMCAGRSRWPLFWLGAHVGGPVLVHWGGGPRVPWTLYAEQHLNAFTLVDFTGVAVAREVDRNRNNFVEASELERAVKALMDADSHDGSKARAKAAEMQAALDTAAAMAAAAEAAELQAALGAAAAIEAAQPQIAQDQGDDGYWEDGGKSSDDGDGDDDGDVGAGEIVDLADSDEDE